MITPLRPPHVAVSCFAMVLLPLLALHPDEKADAKRWLLAPAAGARSEYDATVKVKWAENEVHEEFVVEVFRQSGKDDRDAVLLARPKGEEAGSPGAHLVFVRLDEAGKLKQEESDSLTPFTAQALPSVLFVAIEGANFTPGSRWKGKESAGRGFPDQELEVEHFVEEVEEGAPGLRLTSELPARKDFSAFGMNFSVTSWKRELVLAGEERRLLSARLESEMEYGETGEGAQKRASVVALKETTQRPLAEVELASLPQEIARLKEAQEAAWEKFQGPKRQGFFARLFGGKKQNPSDPLALLDAYEKAHPQGVLASAAPALRSVVQAHIDAVKEAEESEARAQKLVNSQAPDFTLKDMEDKDVSLSDFKGKVVLLSFWGYG